MVHETPAALRQALEMRLQNEARQTGVDLERLRRRAGFERLLVRLELNDPGVWVVKGAMALELRLGDRARMTRDLDLAVRAELGQGARRLEDALEADPAGDGFVFRVGEAVELVPDQLGEKGSRFHVEAVLGGRTFVAVRVDVVARADGLAATDRLPLPGLLSFAGIDSADVDVLPVAYHFAEKLHALVQERLDERSNTRVRDLVDIALFLEGGLEPDGRFVTAVRETFAARATAIPLEIPDPPESWHDRYPPLVDGLDIRTRTCEAALVLLRAFWARARIEG